MPFGRKVDGGSKYKCSNFEDQKRRLGSVTMDIVFKPSEKVWNENNRVIQNSKNSKSGLPRNVAPWFTANSLMVAGKKKIQISCSEYWLTPYFCVCFRIYTLKGFEVLCAHKFKTFHLPLPAQTPGANPSIMLSWAIPPSPTPAVAFATAGHQRRGSLLFY